MEQVWAEIITIGSELVLGQIVDTNAPYIAGALSEIGIGLAWHTTVGDDPERMTQAMSQALERCQVVITTGGIGPTEDDLTREIAARVLGVPLVFHQELLDHIESLFNRMGFKMAPNNRRQAYIPEGATVIHNPRGTAPCFRAETKGRVLICLPGVPRETEPLIVENVRPYLKDKFSPGGRVWMNRVLKVCGVGESNVDHQIKDLIRSSKNPSIGLQASPREVKIRLTARADQADEAARLLDQTETKVRQVIGPLIFGQGEETLPGNTAGRLKEKGLTLAVAEALTGGLVLSELSRHLPPGGLKGGLVLEPPQNAESLADRIMAEFLADIALAVTGLLDDQGRYQVEILVKTADGRQRTRTLTLGGQRSWVADRAATIAMFELWSLLE